jgi:hypothetical protein
MMQEKAKQRRTMLYNILLLAVACLIGLILCEGLVRLFVPVRNVGPTFSEFDPKWGKRLKKNFTCVRSSSEFTMRFSTDSYGFRGPEPKEFPAHPILFLGDSFTSGYGVNDGEEFPAVIRAYLESSPSTSSIPVVNAGSGNIGNGFWLKLLQDEARRYDPRFVVLQLCSNDFADNLTDGLYELNTQGELVPRLGFAPRGAARWGQAVLEAVPWLSYSHLVGFLRQITSEKSGDVPPDTASNNAPPSVSERLTYALVTAALTECALHNWPVLVISVDMHGRRLTELEALLAGLRVPHLTIPSKRERPDLYYKIDGHWTAVGHQYVARLVMDALRRYPDSPLAVSPVLPYAND